MPGEFLFYPPDRCDPEPEGRPIPPDNLQEDIPQDQAPRPTLTEGNFQKFQAKLRRIVDWRPLEYRYPSPGAVNPEGVVDTLDSFPLSEIVNSRGGVGRG